jgi:hypothetical protein
MTSVELEAAEALWALQVALCSRQDCHVNNDDDFLAKTDGSLRAEKAESKATAKKYKWATSLDAIPSRFDSSAVLPMNYTEFPTVQWSEDTIRSVTRSSAGSHGVYYVTARRPEHPGAMLASCFVLKAPGYALYSELYSTIVAMHFGVPTPKCRLLRTDSIEGAQVLKVIKSADKTGRAVLALFDAKWLLMKEYVPGVSLADFSEAGDGAASFKTWFDWPALSALQQTQMSQVLQSLGQLMAIDVLLGNCDRLPLLWNNQGNGGNVYFKCHGSSLGKAVNVDPQIVALMAPEIMAYRSAVSDLLGDSSNPERYQVIRTFIVQSTGYDLPADALGEIIHGLSHSLVLSLRDTSKRDEFLESIGAASQFIACLYDGDSGLDCQRLHDAYITSIVTAL